MYSPIRRVLIVAGISAAALLTGCGVVVGEGNGTVGVALVGSPACGFAEVNVTVTAVRVHQDASADVKASGWKEIVLEPASRVNLARLTNGEMVSLDQTSLPAGVYNQVRLVLDPSAGTSIANSVTLPSAPANQIRLDTPASVQDGIKVASSPFEVTAGERTDLVLNIDACRSVVTNGVGGYALRPVAKVVPTTLNGITGFVDPLILPSNVVISAQQNGVVVGSTVPTAGGEFTVPRLPPGNYDVVFTADNRVTSVVAAVPVEADERTVISSTGTPVTLPLAATSARSIGGTAVLDPASTTDEVAYVSARQSFAAGPNVTVMLRGVDASDSSYTLSNLPSAAPRLAQYRAGQPLEFVTQSNTIPGTGRYAVVASATGYAAGTITSVDIRTGNQASVDFTLEP